MSVCVFCNITDGESTIIFEDEDIVIIKDIKPAAQHHYLAIPKIHIPNVKALKKEDIQLVEKLVEVGMRVLEEKGCNLNDVCVGFHIPPFNSISHLHLHLITPASEMNFISRMIFRPNTWWFNTAQVILNNLYSLD
ncbi:hypothetical protein FQA39_LY05745 [Lamprigera yunnana]|nr:hypothetical protein FQA39_LY05745 [Lamprigera yunnana]